MPLKKLIKSLFFSLSRTIFFLNFEDDFLEVLEVVAWPSEYSGKKCLLFNNKKILLALVIRNKLRIIPCYGWNNVFNMEKSIPPFDKIVSDQNHHSFYNSIWRFKEHCIFCINKVRKEFWTMIVHLGKGRMG